MIVQAPTYFQTPNDLVDHWLPHLGECEVKVLLVIFRKTFGWHKQRDKISLSQLVQLTGSTKTNVGNAVKSLVSKGIVLKELVGPEGRQETYYELIVNQDSNNSYRSQSRTPPGLTAGPPPVPQQDPQKKPLKESSKENLPPLTPPKENFEKVKKKEEEDFSFLSSFNFTDHELRQLCEFPIDQIKRAIDISKHQNIKSSLIGLLLNILRNPAKWPDPSQIQPKKNTSEKFDYAPLNNGYYTEILKCFMDCIGKSVGVIKAAQVWNSKGLREVGEYLERDDGERIYKSDATFLEQIENYFRKKDVNLPIFFEFIGKCKSDLAEKVKMC